MQQERQTDINKIDCKYLFHQHRKRGPVCHDTPHTHPFWQIDIIHKGNGFFIANGMRYEFQGGDTIIIPGGLKHIFSYIDDPCKWLSIKFSVGNYAAKAIPAVFRHRPVLNDLQNIVKKLLPGSRVPENSQQAVLNSILRVYMQVYEMEFGHEFQYRSAFLDRVFEIVAGREGKYITVNEVAEAMGYSAKYASERFRKEAGCRLKKYLDEERFKHAGLLLSFSDASISSIADQLGFSDVYAFSRFFKNRAKQSPRRFRECRLKDL